MQWQKSPKAVVAVVALALFTDVVAYGVILPLLPRLLRERLPDLVQTDQDVDKWASIFLGAYALGLFLFTPIFGYISDMGVSWKKQGESNRSLPFLLGLFSLALATVLIAFSHSLALLLLGRFAQGASAAASWVIGLALLADTFESSQMGFVSGQVFGASTLGYMAGPLIGGWLAEACDNVSAPFYVCIALTMLDMIGRFVIRPQKRVIAPAPVTDHARPPYSWRIYNPAYCPQQTQVEASFTTLLTMQPLQVAGLALLTGAGFYTAVETLLANYLVTTFQLSLGQVSATFTAFMFPYMITSPVVGWICDNRIKQRHRYRLIVLGLILNAPGTLFIYFAPRIVTNNSSIGYVLTLVALFYHGVTGAILLTPTVSDMSYLAELTWPDGKAPFGRIYAVYNMYYSLAMLLGPIVAVSAGNWWILSWCAMGGLLGTSVIYSHLRYRHELKTHANEQ